MLTRQLLCGRNFIYKTDINFLRPAHLLCVNPGDLTDLPVLTTVFTQDALGEPSEEYNNFFIDPFLKSPRDCVT